MFLSCLLRSKVPELPCPNHPNLTIHSLYFQAGCPALYICAHFEYKHPKGHSNVSLAIRNVFEDNTPVHHAGVLNCGFLWENIRFAKDKMPLILTGN